MRRQAASALLDEEGAVLGIERVQPAQIVEEPCSCGAAIVASVAVRLLWHKGMVREGSARSDQRAQFVTSRS
jgi:hypothetical protein